MLSKETNKTELENKKRQLKTSPAQIRAIKKYNAKLPNEQKNYYQYKSKAKNFIAKKGTFVDLLELKNLIDERIKELQGDND